MERQNKVLVKVRLAEFGIEIYFKNKKSIFVTNTILNLLLDKFKKEDKFLNLDLIDLLSNYEKPIKESVEHEDN
jgi:hypothetical protein